MNFPAAFSISFKTAFKRSSNSPLNLVPATIAPKSREIISLSIRDSGTSPEIIRWASPSTIAVLPTPDSPIKTGLFFVRRAKTCITLRISSSRPMTGSSFFFLASSVTLRPYFSRTLYFVSGCSSAILVDAPLKSVKILIICSRFNFSDFKIWPALVLLSSKAKKRCSVEINSSLNCPASCDDFSMTQPISRDK